MVGSWDGKNVMVTGACGTVGRELVRLLLKKDIRRLVAIDNKESEVFFLSEEYVGQDSVQAFLCDLRDRESLGKHMKGIDIVLHAAALKHVVVCERSPQQAVQTNILGTQNVIDAALLNRVERVLFTSSDKAVNPTNVMGTSKLMGERLMTAAHATTEEGGTIFASTRFGNVLGSSGSVMPIFKRQIINGGPVTLTDPNMTRFIMTLQEACRLVLESAFMACGGEVLITKMPVARIEDLANVMIKESSKSNVEIKVIGMKPGEKLYEELMNDEETRRTVELADYFAVFPAFTNIYRTVDYAYAQGRDVGIQAPYNSATQSPLSQEQLSAFLASNCLMGENG